MARIPAQQDYSEPAFYYEYLPPKDAPKRGDEWPEEWDLPGVRVTLSLPCNHDLRQGHVIQDRFVPSEGSVSIFGETLWQGWGIPANEPFNGKTLPVRLMQQDFRRPTLAEAEAEARNAADVASASLGGYMRSRTARLLQREVTIAKANAAHLEVTPESK